jgi:hypothetical protein
MDRGLYFAGSGLEFAPDSKPKKARKKYVHPPIGGCAPILSLPLFTRDWAEQPVAPYFDEQVDRVKFLVAVATGGFEVLVNHALNSIE